MVVALLLVYGFDMDVQWRLLRKRPLAMRALVRLLSCMRPDVHLEPLGRREGLVAAVSGARVRPGRGGGGRRALGFAGHYNGRSMIKAMP